MVIQAGVPQGSIFGTLFLLICINNLTDNLTSNPKLFADDTSLYSTVTDPNATANQINNDLHKINTRVYQWKKNSNPDISKQTQEVIFSCEIKITAHPRLVLNTNPVHETSTPKHLGTFLEFKLNFQKHFENMLNNLNKTIGLLQKLQNTILGPSLLTIYKSFTRLHTLITLILSIIKRIMHLFNKKKKTFSIMQP